MQIVKIPNIPLESYYRISICQDYDDGDIVIGSQDYTEEEFKRILPVLKNLFTYCIGEYALRDYLYNYSHDEDAYDIYEELPIVDIYGELCHSIYTKEDVFIIYYDSNGMNYNVFINF